MLVTVSSNHSILQVALEELVAKLGHQICSVGEAEVGLYDLNSCSRPLPSPPPVPTLALVTHEDCTALEVLRLGYRGYVQRASDLAVLKRALVTVRRGEMWAERRILSQAFEQPAPTLQTLTQREKDILNCVTRGLSNQEIAEATQLSLNTVKGYVSRLYDKLEVRNRTELVITQKYPQ